MISYATLPGETFKSNADSRRAIALSPRTRKARVMMGLLSLFVVMVGMFLFSSQSEASKNDQIVIVHQGDTVWSIAQKVVSPSQDVRDVVLDIEERNGLSVPTLQPGMRLKVPHP